MKGALFGFLGSGEFKPWTEPVDRWLLEQAGHGSGRVLVLPTASAPEGDEVFDRWGKMGVDHYASLGIPAEVVELKTHEDAQRVDLVKLLDDASLVYFSGGNPAYLAGTLLGTAFWNSLLMAMADGLAYGGCSAGVACLGDRAVDSRVRSFDQLDQLWQPGLGLFPKVFFGVHWDTIDNFAPGAKQLFIQAVPPGGRLLAVDEDTAVVGDGASWQVMGNGGAYLMENGAWQEFGSGDSFDAELSPVFA